MGTRVEDSQDNFYVLGRNRVGDESGVQSRLPYCIGLNRVGDES